MNANSRDKLKNIIENNCGKCHHAEVCRFIDIFDSAAARILHEAQIDDYLMTCNIECKYREVKENE